MLGEEGGAWGSVCSGEGMCRGQGCAEGGGECI
jgi:hypothetical protein